MGRKCTLLSKAAERGKEDIVILLLNAGAAVNAQNGVITLTSLPILPDL